MGLFSKLFGKEENARIDAPRPGQPWQLTVNGIPTTYFGWADIEAGLRQLEPDNDHFLILEQKDPKDSSNYWYIQSAIALAGPDQGKYTIGVGYGGGGKRAYFELHVPRMEEALPYFQQAYQSQPIDLSDFEDQSDMLF